MIYLFQDQAGSAQITLDGDGFKHLIKARRHQVGDTVTLRNPNAEIFYRYEIVTIDKRAAHLHLIDQEAIAQEGRNFHLAWSMIDPKSIEKVLPALCELGVTKISFIQAKRSQQNFKIDTKRFDRIIENAMQQSGRLQRLEYQSVETLEDFIKQYPETLVLDFSPNILKKEEFFGTVLIGPEGGFDAQEKARLKTLEVRRLDTPNVLRSETAALAVAALMLL